MTNFRKMMTLAVLTAMGWGALSAKANPIVDGRYDSSEGYNYAVSIDPNKYDASKNPGDPATMYLYQDTTTYNLYVAVSLPLTYVDNSYGTKSVGWNGKIHKFTELVGSDKSSYEVRMGGSKVLEFSIDYLYDNNGVWDSGVDGREGSESVNGAVINSASSMGYNMSLPGASAYTVDSPNLTNASYDPSALIDWVFEATYEFEIDGDILGNQLVLGDQEWLNGFELKLAGLHASPNKGAEFKNIIPPPPSVVPEPSSASLLGLAVIGLLARRRRQRN